MTRDPSGENARLRRRLNDTEARLRLLASAVLTDDGDARALARLLLDARLAPDSVSRRPLSDTPSGEP